MINNQIAKFGIVGPRIGRSDPIYGTGIVYIISHNFLLVYDIICFHFSCTFLTFHLSADIGYWLQIGCFVPAEYAKLGIVDKSASLLEVIQIRNLSSNIISNPYSLHKNPN